MKLRSESSRAGGDQGPAEQSQSSGTAITNDPEWTGRWPGLMILLAGWLIPQFVLLGPA